MKKMIAAIITLIFIFISGVPFSNTFQGAAFAEEKEPEEYIVQKADSLWGISDLKLEDPFLWPRVWNVNPQIDNPDLIYPGTKLIIPTREQLLGLPPAPEKMPLSILKRKMIGPPPKLVFEFPEGALDKYIIDKEDFITCGWIARKFPGIGKLLFTEKGSRLIDKGDVVYLETEGGTEPGTKYYTIKSVKRVKHPVTEEKMGEQVSITGVLEIIGTDNNILKGVIRTNYDDISVGDGLLPYTEMEPPLFTEDPRTPDINGYIVESRINSSISSTGDIIFLDKGSDDGVSAGDVFQAIAEEPVRRPVGKLQVIKTEPETSTAVILKTNREINLGMHWAQK